MRAETIQHIKDSCSIVDVFESLTNQTLKGNGRQLTALCPFHDDKHKGNFFIYPDTNSFHCFACGTGGDVIKFVVQYCAVNYIEALQIIADICHIPTDTSTSYHLPIKRAVVAKKKVIPTSFINEGYLMRTLDKDSALKEYLCTLIDPDNIELAFNKYKVGADKEGNIIYWYIDKQGGIRSGKVMQYGADGHRQGNTNWVHSILLKNNIYDTFNFQSVPFGEHLLNDIADNSEIAVVEAEKTALICDAVFNDSNIRVWLAVGGKKSDVSFYEKLRPYRIHLYPDVDSIEQWQGIADRLKKEGFRIKVETDWMRYAEGGKDDIADILLKRLGRCKFEQTPKVNNNVIPIYHIQYDWDICNFADNWLYQEMKDNAINGMPF